MGPRDFLQYHDESIVEAFNAKPPKDEMPGLRKKLMKGLKGAMEALAANKPKHSWYKTDEKGNSVAHIKLGNTPLVFKQATTFGVPRERLSDFYTEVGKSCEAGHLDEMIRAAHEENKAGSSPTAQRAPRNAGTGQKRIMSPEHKEKIAAARRGFKSADGTVDLAAYRKWVEAGSDTSKLPK